jgi:formate/nitrite transporter FocA (FNT family)
VVIHEVVREEGEQEIQRSAGALIWSGLAAGLSMGFSLLAMALLHANLPAAPWRILLDSPGYCVGFVIAILGRQQLFTESTLTGMLPLLLKPNLTTFAALMRTWGLVLASNLIGTIVFAALLSPSGIFPDAVHDAMAEAGRNLVAEPLVPKLIKAVLAGWLIALIVWVMPSAQSARLFVILILTYMVALGRFPHVVAGSVEAAFAVFNGDAGIAAYVSGFLLPTLLGNTLGGVAMVALLNHAPGAQDMKRSPAEDHAHRPANPAKH